MPISITSAKLHHPVLRTQVTLDERLECRRVAVLCAGNQGGIRRLPGRLDENARPHSINNARPERSV